MDENDIVRYFLGANTAQGFYSLYDSFVSLDEGDFLWIIKGGAGCGKSSFMKKIGEAAEKAGLRVEYAFCSADPDSLDGVYIPQLKTAYMDGTAPHIADARMAASDSSYLNLGAYYDRKAMVKHKDELLRLKQETARIYSKAYALLGAAGSIRRGWQKNLAGSEALEAAISRVKGIGVREFGKRHRENGREIKRFLSVISSTGLAAFPETVKGLCNRAYSLDNRFLLGEAALGYLANMAISTGYDIFTCPNPLCPESYEAVFVPALSLGFFCSDSVLNLVQNTRRVRLDSFVSGEKRGEQRKCKKLSSALIDEAISALHETKLTHDKIEALYNPNVNFDEIYKLSKQHIAELSLK